MRTRTALLAALALTATSPAQAAPLVTTLCGDGVVEALMPVGAGPLTLSEVHCLELPANTSGAYSSPAPSPDGTAFFTFDIRDGLSLGHIATKAPLQHFAAQVTGLGVFDFRRPFAWFHDGHSVLAVTQDIMTPLRPYLASIDGKASALPALTSPAGSLDEIHWTGDDGLAVALFGAKGDHYLPKHADPRPTIALVDAAAGRVIQSTPLASLVPDPSRTLIGHVASRKNQQGKIEALMFLTPDRWILWKQGDKPRRLPIGVSPWPTPFALSPDGTAVLVMRGLTANGMICEHDPNCPPPTPTSGPIAELFSTTSGRIIWSLTGTAKYFANDGAPAISPDGRFALISMPTADRIYAVALIAMASGKVLQLIPSSGPRDSILGFSPDSRKAWISNGRQLVVYAIGQ